MKIAEKVKGLCKSMTHCILFFLGLITLCIGIKTADKVHKLALTTAIIPFGWGYFSSPLLFQCQGWNFNFGCLPNLHRYS